MAESIGLNDLVFDNSLNIDELQTQSNILNSDENHTSTEVSYLDNNLLNSNNTDNTVTPHRNQDLSHDTEDVSIVETNFLSSDENNESTKLCNLDGNLLNNHNTDNTLTSLHNQDLSSNTEVDASILTNVLNSDENHESPELSNLDSNLLSSNYSENLLTPFHSQDSPYDTEVNPTNERNLNSDENVESTEVSNLDSNLLSHNDAEIALTPLLNQNSLNDTEVNSIIDKSLTTNQNLDYKVGDIVWARIGKYPFWPSVVCIDPTSNTYISKIILYYHFCLLFHKLY